jgi:serine/threonine protein kinase
MGEVWKARDRRVDRVVAIKRLKAEHTDRFRREARAIAALNHPRICKLFDVGPDYLVMEYVRRALELDAFDTEPHFLLGAVAVANDYN